MPEFTRFHATRDELYGDGGFDTAKLDDPNSTEEWILALHEEHWKVLEQLAAAKKATETDRVARMIRRVGRIEERLKACITPLGVARTKLGEVLGHGPVLETLQDVERELRATRQLAENFVNEEGAA